MTMGLPEEIRTMLVGRGIKHITKDGAHWLVDVVVNGKTVPTRWACIGGVWTNLYTWEESL